MALQGTFLRSRVARRIFTLFLLSALIPAAGIALLAIRQFDDLLIQQKRTELLHMSKADGMALYERLTLLEDLLHQLAHDVAQGDTQLGQRVDDKLASLAVVRGDGTVQPLVGTPVAMTYVPNADERRHLAQGKALLFSQEGATWGERVFLAREVGHGNAVDLLIAEVDPTFLWDDPSELPYRTDLCVLRDGPVAVYCSHAPSVAMLAAIGDDAAPRSGHRLDWSDMQGRHIAGFYPVQLKSMFFTRSWTVVVSQPESEALAAASSFMRMFLPVLALAILVVVMLSTVQIRRTLVPLERLIEGTRRLAAQDFNDRIEVARGDEFGELAESFNTMASRLGRQFRAMTTLSEIDRAILSTLDVDRVLEMILRRLHDIVAADYVCITIVDPENPRTARAHVQDYVSSAQAISTRTELVDADIASLVEMGNAALWLDADAAASAYLAPLAGLPACAWLVLPMVWKERLAGVIVLAYRERPALGEEEIAHARDFRDRLGVALSSAAREEELYYQARYDALTGLPNRLYFKDELAQSLGMAARAHMRVAVLFIDLDHFKDINDTSGHSAGDLLLRETAARLKACVRDSDFIARLGGDEFTVLLPGISAPESAGLLADKVLQALSKPYIVEGDERFLSASIGIAIYPQDGDSADALLKNADTAMYRAKSGGRNRSVYFEDRMNAEARARVALERELRQAVAQQQFVLHYQPQLDLRTGRICGAEALIRWNHPERGLISPFHFIALAEDVGLIEPLGRWIVDEACAQYKRLAMRGIRLKRVSVNVSARQFRQSDFVDFVLRTVARHEIAPRCLELEITESLLMDAKDEIEQALRTVSDLGVRLAIDDFGTGYSSLAYLKQFAFDVLKIDRSFVKDLDTDSASRAIAHAIVAMAHSLDKEVVAEGVETAAQLDILRELGCEEVQGYYFAKPMSAEALGEFIAARTDAADMGEAMDLTPASGARAASTTP